MQILFPFSEYWWFFAAFTALVVLLLALDLGVFHRNAHVVSLREAAVWSTVWICLALIFNYLFYRYALWKFTHDPGIPGLDPGAAARQVGLEFLTGYLVEKSLSIDNIFVFVLIFGYFAVPPKYQHRVLFYGIFGALILRSLFIAVGSALMQYHWVTVLFGIFLIVTGLKMWYAPDKGIDPGRNPLIRLFRKLVPITSEPHDQSLFVRVGKVLHATPLFVTLLFVELTDIIFAADSVPAIFALTNEPLIVYTSNVFAILGLRALYFLLAGVIGLFHLLKYGLAIILIFVGLKMAWLNELFGGKFPIGISLLIISGVIAGSVVLSVVTRRRLSHAS